MKKKIWGNCKKNEYKLILFIKLDLSYKYLNLKGGMNVLENIMIVFLFINKMNKDKIFENDVFEMFNGYFLSKKRKDMLYSFINFIVRNYLDDEVNVLFCKIGKLLRIKNG